MRTLFVLSALLFCFWVPSNTYSADEKEPKIKYRAAKDLDFEKLMIQGHRKRGQITVVTGSNEKGADGLLSLRQNFLDRIALDFGEEYDHSSAR